MQQFLFDRDWQRRFPFLVMTASATGSAEVVKQVPQPAAGETKTRATNTSAARCR
jgi:hypothetical protein